MVHRRWPARCLIVVVASGAMLAGAASLPALAIPVSGRPAGPASGRLAAAAPAQPSGPAGVRARGADLVNAGTGRQLWGRRPDIARPMGSITKVMTALLVIRAGHLNRKIKVTRAAVRYVIRNDASNAGLIPGDVLTARQLLYAMLIPSGCDAAYLLANAYGPGRRAFVHQMNAMAARLGLTATRFSNYDGLPIPTELSTYSSPANLIQLGEQAMRYPLFRQIVAERRRKLPATRHHHRYAWQSTNLLLNYYRGAIGIKTGSTLAAGDCLLFEARRDGRTLIGVVLHANPTDSIFSRFKAARLMLNWGFSQIGAGGRYGSVRIS
jgi:serine-type D-Ala-D-Ala carboxypeptidase (penicillin-binding protein 5/6)